MRLDVITVFPEYLAPLELSLIGRARREGLVDLRVHDLRDWTHDRHRTVDDTPYGGGPGMVMRPEPWGEALDELCRERPGAVPHLVVPGPGGTPFSQAMARELAREPWLAFACGRYEGIDERVYEHAAERMPVSVVSLGDYVLNGGEVAVLAIVEAVARLLPGVVGNAESLVEESHEDGLLEYPVYTKPPSWRGREVPPVLRSGDHAAIAGWRDQQRRQRTAARRPDLLPPSAAITADGMAATELTAAVPADVPEILTLAMAAAYARQGGAGAGRPAPAVDEEAVRAGVRQGATWVLRSGGRLVGAVSGRREAATGEPVWVVTPVLAPDLAGRGLARALAEHSGQRAPADLRVVQVELAPGDPDERTLRRAGYHRAGRRPDGMLLLRRRR
ncbi:tRNA (guanosine(37)-N1)-methyltransferase TrmD [Ornithinicoccus halotolerans]|uniref:tRNA (guanosine(37)-N1)-methyltransferase TrmD n=1 Tax=Ornithinicoccus halotolerans TaxID=1748220 RepID=UPI001294ADBC|nr:tRNA (guanosine(37)-N1)-methyltransferase TrmD [Ornithinicoccus halotolerans]